jgi:hypothetical protein
MMRAQARFFVTIREEISLPAGRQRLPAAPQAPVAKSLAVSALPTFSSQRSKAILAPRQPRRDPHCHGFTR